MCHVMHTNEIKGKLFLCLCDHFSPNALSHWIVFRSKAIYLEAMASKITLLILSKVAPTSTFSNVNIIVINFQIFITYMDIDPFFRINNIISFALTTTWLIFETSKIALERTTLCMPFANCLPLLSDQCFNEVFLTFNNKNNSFNDSYSKIGIPCKRMCMTKKNPIFHLNPKFKMSLKGIETWITLRSWQT